MKMSTTMAAQSGNAGSVVSVGRADLRACVRGIHDGALQEVATLRVALSVWARAAEGGDVETAQTMVMEVRESTDRLLDELTSLERMGRRWLDGEESQ